MIVLVCGGRDYARRLFLATALDALHKEHRFTLLVHGKAGKPARPRFGLLTTGADLLAGEWAAENGVEVREFPADWKGLGRKAGPIRNQQMLDESKPDIGVAFHGSTGTADMASRLRKAGVRLYGVAQLAKRVAEHGALGVLVQVTAPHFTAGLEMFDGVAVRAAPILDWALGMERDELRDYFRRKEWRAVIVKPKEK